MCQSAWELTHRKCVCGEISVDHVTSVKASRLPPVIFYPTLSHGVDWPHPTDSLLLCAAQLHLAHLCQGRLKDIHKISQHFSISALNVFIIGHDNQHETLSSGNLL